MPYSGLLSRGVDIHLLLCGSPGSCLRIQQTLLLSQSAWVLAESGVCFQALLSFTETSSFTNIAAALEIEAGAAPPIASSAELVLKHNAHMIYGAPSWVQNIADQSF